MQYWKEIVGLSTTHLEFEVVLMDTERESIWRLQKTEKNSKEIPHITHQ